MAKVFDLTLSDDENCTQPFPQNCASAAVSVKTERRSCPPAIPAPQFNNNPDVPKLTVVNGKGFWKSWTRSFKTTLLKLLDLIDNSVDGITAQDTPGFTGRVHIYPDVYVQSTTNRKGKKHVSTTGLCIRNNSPDRIVPLAEALVVHTTTKVDAGEIGENGVGLKQACAALCDMSFVLVKNGSNANIELGIVAKSLQREEGPYLPAFQFSNEKGEGRASLREQMFSLFSQPNHDDVAQCIALYGADVSGGDPSLAAGIDGLCKRFDDICHDFYGNDHVFELILNRIHHGQIEGLVKRALDAQQKITVNQLIKDLQREIPRTYLHVPESFEFIVGKQKLTFKHWQERLVELTTFTVTVGSTIPWKQNFEVSDEHPNSYDLRLFIGFDRHRIADSDVEADTGEKRESKNASLYFYSRQSGRLIKSEPDARHMLGLATGSSLFGSALTIIIDDIGGYLPLHPTKQDIAFGLEDKGAVHEENLFAWVGSVTKFYYRYHLKKYNNLKKVLSAKVSQYVDSKLPKEPNAYDNSNFTTFELTFEQYRNSIRVDTKLAKEIIGPDTYFRLLPESGVETSNKKKRSRSHSQKKQSGIESGRQPLSCVAESTVKRSRTNPPSYREESDLDSDAAVDMKMEANKCSWSHSQRKQPGNESDRQPLSCVAESTAKRSRTKPISYCEESDPDSDAAVHMKMETNKCNRSHSQKKQSGSESGQQPLSCVAESTAKRSRLKPISYREESDPDSDAAVHMKMEASKCNRSHSSKKQPGSESGRQPLSCVAESTAKRSRLKPISYREESDPDSDAVDMKMEASKRSRSYSSKKQPGNESGRQPLSCVAESTAKQSMKKSISYREESDPDSNVQQQQRSKNEELSDDDVSLFSSDSDAEMDMKMEANKCSLSHSHKKQPGNEFGRQPLSYVAEPTGKQPRSKPVSYHEESDPDLHDGDIFGQNWLSDAEKDTKMEAATVRNELDHDLGCIDLCESLDEEGNGRPPIDNAHVSRENNTLGAPDDEPQDTGSNLKLIASQSVTTDSSKIHDLEQLVKQLKSNSRSSKIRTLENENKELQKQLLQKEKIISVLKKRLGV